MKLTIEFINAITPLLWPTIIGLLLWKIFPSVKEIMTSRGFSVKIAGMEVSVQNATEQLRSQIEDLQKQVILLRSGKTAEETNAVQSSAPSPRILWVDDFPENNAIELARLADDGVQVTQVKTTDDALNTLKHGAAFDAIVSDMGRQEHGGNNPQAGLLLLRAIKQANYNVPFMIYASHVQVDKNREEVKRAGGDGATASPVELLEWIAKKTKKS